MIGWGMMMVEESKEIVLVGSVVLVGLVVLVVLAGLVESHH